MHYIWYFDTLFHNMIYRSVRITLINNKSILTLDGQIDLGKSSVNPLREAPECSLCCHPCCTWRVGDWMNPWFIWKNGKFKLKYRITFPLSRCLTQFKISGVVTFWIFNFKLAKWGHPKVVVFYCNMTTNR